MELSEVVWEWLIYWWHTSSHCPSAFMSCWPSCFQDFMSWPMIGLWKARGKLCLHLFQEKLWVKILWFLLGQDILGRNLTNVWERISFAIEELCKCILQKALSYVFVFQMHKKLFSGAHTTPLGNGDLSAGKIPWCIGRGKFSAFCGGSLPCHHLEMPIVGYICCFGLPSLYSVFSGNRISTFLWGTPVPHSYSS